MDIFIAIILVVYLISAASLIIYEREVDWVYLVPVANTILAFLLFIASLIDLLKRITYERNHPDW